MRAVDASADDLFDGLAASRNVHLRPLPPPPNEPPDEQTDRFRTALEAARATDASAEEALVALADDQTASIEAARAERDLRDRVRAGLGMPPRKAATVRSLAEHARENGIDPSFDLGGRAADGGRGPTSFQTLLLPDAFQRALAKIRDTAKVFEEETGVSTLHVAFGFLEWFESENSDKALVSPLVLVKVELSRSVSRSRYQYSLAASDEDPQVNLTLSERLNRDFKVRLPAMRDGDAIGPYLAKVGG